MVDSTTKIVTTNTNAQDLTRLHKTAAIWYSNILALIKLR